MDKIRLEQIELEILNSGVWGTIALHSLSAAKSLAAHTGATYGLLCHSVEAAYEAVLRHFGARLAALPHGDVVVTGEVSTPANSLIALCVGATPVFCPVRAEDGMSDPEALEQLLKGAEQPVRAVVIDYLAESAPLATYPLDRVSEICHAHEVPLILWAGGCIGVRHGDRPLTAFADAVLYSLGQGCAIDVGMGGLITTDNDRVHVGAFAYHNCGRSVGAGCSLVMDDIVGGDMRVTEWVAAAAEEVLRQGALAKPAPRKLVRMQNQPVFAGKDADKALEET